MSTLLRESVARAFSSARKVHSILRRGAACFAVAALALAGCHSSAPPPATSTTNLTPEELAKFQAMSGQPLVAATPAPAPLTETVPDAGATPSPTATPIPMAGGAAGKQGLSTLENDPIIKRSQLNFEVVATILEDGNVGVTVTNKTKSDALFGPKCFAFLNLKTRAMDPVTPGEGRMLPLTMIQPDKSVSGEIALPEGVDLPSTRLLFIQPDMDPAMARITPQLYYPVEAK